jgi:hypothetical protein
MEYPKIDYLYWRDIYEKTITGSKPNKRVQKSLNGIRSIILKDYPEKSNNKLAILLRNEKIENRDMSKLKQLADEIANDIYTQSNSNDIESKYLTIFDAINAWGGVSAKGMYNPNEKSKPDITTRKSWKSWIDKYIRAVENVKMGNTDIVLNNLDKMDPGAEKTGIENLGIAFASKHMWYWSDYFLKKWESGKLDKPEGSTLNERYMVFDMRISKLLFYKSPTKIPYNDALVKFNLIKNKLNSEIQNENIKAFNSDDIEKALFAFSQYYFANDIDLWNTGSFGYSDYPDYFSKEEYIEFTKVRIEQCKDQKSKLSNGKDFKIACEIFSKAAPIMDKWMNGGEIIAKEKKAKDLKKESKDKLKENKVYIKHLKKSNQTAVFKLITIDKIYYTYRKNISSIEGLKKIMKYALNKNQNWPKKWFDNQNKIQIVEIFDKLDSVINYIKQCNK